MDNLTISIFGNQIFLAILNEIKALSKFKFVNFNDLNSCINESKKHERLVVFFRDEKENLQFKKIIRNGLPLILVNRTKNSKEIYSGEFIEELSMPFKILDFEQKIISLNNY